MQKREQESSFSTHNGLVLASDSELLQIEFAVQQLVEPQAAEQPVETLLVQFIQQDVQVVNRLSRSRLFHPSTAGKWMIDVSGNELGYLLKTDEDRLLQLPDKMARREGIFKIMNWR